MGTHNRKIYFIAIAATQICLLFYFLKLNENKDEPDTPVIEAVRRRAPTNFLVNTTNCKIPDFEVDDTHITKFNIT